MYIYIYVDILYIFICIDFWSEFAKAAATYFPLFFWPSWNFFFQEELPGPGQAARGPGVSLSVMGAPVVRYLCRWNGAEGV